jgi:hypothetical protein
MNPNAVKPTAISFITATKYELHCQFPALEPGELKTTSICNDTDSEHRRTFCKLPSNQRLISKDSICVEIA